MYFRKWLRENVTDVHREKAAKILLAILIAVFSVLILASEVPESNYVQETLESLEESKTTVMEFSGATIAVSVAITVLPDDIGSPIAGTLADMNKYFVFIFAVLHLERLVVVEGMKFSFVYIIPIACVLYIFAVVWGKAFFRNLAAKLMILGLAVVCVIPISTHFTEKVCEDYLVYVDETIAEANAGAEKVNEVTASGDEWTTVLDKLTDAFETVVQGASDLLAYFENVLKKCVNSLAIMIVTTCVLPIFVLLFFRWLLKELFSLNLSGPRMDFVLQERKSGRKAIERDWEKAEGER